MLGVQIKKSKLERLYLVIWCGEKSKMGGPDCLRVFTVATPTFPECRRSSCFFFPLVFVLLKDVGEMGTF